MLFKKNILFLTLFAFLLYISSSTCKAMQDELKETGRSSIAGLASPALSSTDEGEEASSIVPYVVGGVVVAGIITVFTWGWNSWRNRSSSHSASSSETHLSTGLVGSTDNAVASTLGTATTSQALADVASTNELSHTGGSMNLTSIDMSRASLTSITFPRDNDDLFPHLVRLLSEGDYPGIIFEHTTRKLVMSFDCQSAGTMQIALVCVREDNTNSVDTSCSTGTQVNKRDFPLVSSLIVSTVRDAVHTHHKEFSRALNAVLQAVYDITQIAHYRLSSDQRLREFALDVRDQPGTSFRTLYGVSAPLGHPSLGKRVNAYN